MHTDSAAIIAIGDELSLGQKLDTNSQWLADILTARGLTIVEHATVPDDERLISDTILRLATRADAILITGGLGPTADDLTRAALATALDDRLVEDAEALQAIRSWYATRGRNMPETNRVQALRPSTARSLPNPNGTAPGMHAELRIGDRTVAVACLPGPPGEMRPMFEEQVLPALRPKPGRSIRSRLIQLAGIGESNVAQRLGPLMDRTNNPLVGTTASTGIVTVRIRHESGERGGGERELDNAEHAVREHVGEHVFATGDTGLAEAVLDRLRISDRALCVAESCTGGMLGQLITSVPGSSDVFLGGFLAYANEMKQSLLGVPVEILREDGSVSRQCAIAMASGALQRTGADHALSVTGIAGPGGGSPGKPVGTVWIAHASSDNDPDARCFRFRGGREAVRRWSVNSALSMLWFSLVERREIPLLGQVE